MSLAFHNLAIILGYFSSDVNAGCSRWLDGACWAAYTPSGRKGLGAGEIAQDSGKKRDGLFEMGGVGAYARRRVRDPAAYTPWLVR